MELFVFQLLQAIAGTTSHDSAKMIDFTPTQSYHAGMFDYLPGS